MHTTKQSIYSISAICRLLKLSRGQFYNLQKKGIFPPSLKDERTGRSYFNEELKNICIEIKKTGVGYNQQYHLFYETRKKPTVRKHNNNIEDKYSDIIEMLKQMGLSGIFNEDISSALSQIYSDSNIPEDEGILVSELFKYFKNNK